MKLRWCRSTQRLHSPVKHCGLSSRRSRVQIPAGASPPSFLPCQGFDKKCDKKNKKLQDLDKNNRISMSSGHDSQSNKDKSNKQAADTLLNSVRSSPSTPNDQHDLWTDFKNYLIHEGQRKHSIRNKVGYAKRFHYILESLW